MESSSLQELEQIPGVGKTIARDMHNIGIHSTSSWDLFTLSISAILRPRISPD